MRRSVRSVLIWVCAFASVVISLAGAPPARADINYLPSARTSAFVTELGLNHGNGTIDTLVRVDPRDQVRAIHVRVPASSGGWGTRTVDTAGAHCTAGAGPVLDYVCRPLGGALLRSGSYHLRLPVSRRSGPFAGIWGTVEIIRPTPAYGSDYDYILQSDTFPVVDKATGLRSTGEVRALDTYGNGYRQIGRGTLSVTAVIAPTEKITWIVISLPAAAGTAWALPTSPPDGPLPQCTGRNDPALPSTLQIWCLGPKKYLFPVGASTINLPMTVIGPTDGPVGTVSLVPVDGDPIVVDTFAIRADFDTYP